MAQNLSFVRGFSKGEGHLPEASRISQGLQGCRIVDAEGQLAVAHPGLGVVVVGRRHLECHISLPIATISLPSVPGLRYLGQGDLLVDFPVAV